MSADHKDQRVGRHQRLLDWDEVELPSETATAPEETPQVAKAAAPAKAAPQGRMDRLRSLLGRKSG